MINKELILKLRKITQAGMLNCKTALEECNGDFEKSILWLQKKGIAKALKKISDEALEGIIWSTCKENTSSIIEINCQTDFIVKNNNFIDFVKTIAELICLHKPKNINDLLKIKNTKNNKTINNWILELSGVLGEKLSIKRFFIIEKKDSECFGIYNHLNLQISSIVVLKNKDAILSKNMAMQITAMNPEYISIDNIKDSEKEKIREIVIANSNDKIKNKPEKIQKIIVEGIIRKKINELTLLNQKYIIENAITIEKLLEKENNSILRFCRFKVSESN